MIQIKLKQLILKQIQNEKKLTVALSGGLDSMVLLHVLKMIQLSELPHLNLQAIHVHHGLSINADRWQQHCQSYCNKWQVSFKTKYVLIDRDLGNIEAQARNARYNAFKSELTAQDILCTAQHQDDQVETFFLALKRGSGLAGLSAMPKKHQNYGFTLWRPFLDVARSELEDYAQQHHLTWVEDESNQDESYDRNFIRAAILPLLNQRFPQFNQLVARSINHCQDQNALLHHLLSAQLNELTQADRSLNFEPLLAKNELERNEILRLWIETNQFPILSKLQLAQLWQTIVLAKQDTNPKLMIKSHQFRRFKKNLYCLPIYQNLTEIQLNWSLANPILLPDNLGYLKVDDKHKNCRLPTSSEKVSIRFFADLKNYSIVGRQHSRSLKKIWQEKKISPWMRNRIPLIFYNEILICAVGKFVTLKGEGKEIAFILSP